MTFLQMGKILSGRIDGRQNQFIGTAAIIVHILEQYLLFDQFKAFA